MAIDLYEHRQAFSGLSLTTTNLWVTYVVAKADDLAAVKSLQGGSHVLCYLIQTDGRKRN